MNNRVLVTGSTGKIGGAVATQLLEKGITVRAMVHRDDARSARLRESGAEVVVADMFDIQQVTAAMDGVDRLYFNPPYHPHALDSAVSFAVAARRTGVQAVVALGQWLASPGSCDVVVGSLTWEFGRNAVSCLRFGLIQGSRRRRSYGVAHVQGIRDRSG